MRTERLPARDVAHRYYESAPDLAVEILSPDGIARLHTSDDASRRGASRGVSRALHAARASSAGCTMSATNSKVRRSA